MRLQSQLTKIESGATPYEILIGAKLDWTVEKRPRYFEYNDNYVEVPGKFSLIRTDKQIELNTCTDRWIPQQNIETIELAYNAFKSQNLEISPGVNISLMAEGPVYKGLEDPKIYRRHDLLLLGVSARS